MQNAARVIPIHDANLIRYAIVRGLKHAIRVHVLQSGATDLDMVIRAARIAEVALSASGPSDEVTKLTDQVAQLLAKLTVPTAVAALDTPLDEGRRRVAFADDQRSPTARPPLPYRAPPLWPMTVVVNKMNHVARGPSLHAMIDLLAETPIGQQADGRHLLHDRITLDSRNHRNGRRLTEMVVAHRISRPDTIRQQGLNGLVQHRQVICVIIVEIAIVTASVAQRV